MAGNLTAMIASIFSGSAVSTDPYFNLTTLLLSTTATNGAQNNIFQDSSTNNFTITRNGNTTQGTFSPFSQTGWGNYFDGTASTYLSLPSNAAFAWGTGAYTVETWVYQTSRAVTDATIFTSNGGSGGFLAYITPAGAVKIDQFGGSVILTGSANDVPLNTWCHVAYVRSSTSSNDTKVYVNGVLKATGTDATNWTASSSPQIGMLTTNTNYAFIGYMSNLRLTKGGALYTSTFTPSTTPLTTSVSAGTVSLLTCQSNRFVDNSTNNFTITKNGNTSVVPFSPFAPTSAWSASTVGGSGYFDGTGDYLTTPDNAAFNLGSSDFLIEAWVYNQSTTNFKMIMGQWNTGQVSYTLRQNASKWVFTYTTNGTTEVAVTGTSNQVLNAWTHLAVIRTGNTLGLFVNGTRETTASMTGVTIHNNTGVFSVGAAGNGGDLYVGYIGSSRLVLGTLPSGYDATQSTLTLPTAPFTSTASTSILLNFTNSGIYDATAKNVLETVGNAQVSTAISAKWGSTSMLFNSDTSWLQQPASVLYGFGTGNFTVECWFYLTASPTTEKGLFHINTAVNSTTAGYAVSTTTTGFNFYAAGTFYASTTTAPVGQWNHLAYVKNSGTVNVYLNGSLIQNGSKADSQNLTNPLCYVGLIYTTASGNLRYSGYMQDFRVTRFARYTANFTPPTTAFPVQ